MRHVLIAVATLMLVWVRADAGNLTLSAQPDNVETNFTTSSETEITISFSSLKTISGDGGVNIELPSYFKIGSGTVSGPNQTVLPTYTAILAVPENAVLSVTIESDEFAEFPNFQLASATDEDREWINVVESSNSNFPDELVTFEYAGKMRDLNLARLTIYPVQYNYNAKTLKAHHTLTIRAHHAGGDILPPHRTVSEAFYPIYNSILTNKSLLEDVQLRRGGYWIIAPQPLAQAALEFSGWKKAMGFDVRVIETPDISSYPTYTVIGEFLSIEYDAADIKPDYICLIGDAHITSGVATHSYPNPYGMGQIASDNYYSYILGDDYFPDLFVGRISVTNTAQLADYLEKYYGYARFPYMDDTDWYHYGTMVAGSNYPSPRLTKMWCREMMIKHGYTDVDQYLNGGDPVYAINNSINRGVTFINYRGYGYPDGWTSPFYVVSNVYQLSNGPRYGVMTSIVCGTGDFEYYECLGEAWIRAADKGGTGFIGTSNPDTHTKWNNAIDCGIYWGLFEDKTYGLAQCQLAGKMNCYNSFPEAIYPGGRVEGYFNSYNDLGDPQLQCWTDIPKEMIVTHIDSAAIGEAGVVITVHDELGDPLANAYVCLWETDNVFVGKFTDDLGHAAFQITLPQIGGLKVTITEPLHMPYESTIHVYSAGLGLALNSHDIDDDNDGNSSGNGDTRTNPVETIELTTTLKNFGDSETATSVTGVLSSTDELINVVSASSAYNDISPGDSSESQQPYVIEIDAAAPDGYSAELQLNISSNGGSSWQSFIFLPIYAVDLGDISCTVLGDNDGNGVLDRGETGEFVFDVYNSGSIDGLDISAKLRSADPYVTISDSTGSFGDIDINSSGDNTDDRFALAVEMAAYNGRQVEFELEFTDESGQIQVAEYTHMIGIVNTEDPIGPDEYGYYCFDDTDVEYLYHPIYDWIPIESSWSYVNLTDDSIWPRNLPFNVTYYGESFSTFSICDNGYITMGEAWWANFLNTNIPAPQNAPAMIAPFWDDMAGPLYVRYHHDEENGRFIIGWNNVRSNDTYQYQTFEIIILDTEQWPTTTGDNEIIFQYQMATNPYSA
ncbi:MAG: hypothetical protein GY839_17305, partial [candidate division Zixibacteria bacterium]|nr:hypothetical protein [candidate division Zixibacteria bacterium]